MSKQNGTSRNEKHPGGRPSKYRTEFAGQARKLCLLGATDADLADFFEVSESTVNLWKQAHPEFSESLKAGKAHADAIVTDRLFQRAIGYSHKAVKIFKPKGEDPTSVEYIERYAPDTTACIFWLKNRQPDKWRDKQDHEHAGGLALSITDEDDALAQQIVHRRLGGDG